MSELSRRVKAIVFVFGGATSVVFRAVGATYRQLISEEDVHDKRGHLPDLYL